MTNVTFASPSKLKRIEFKAFDSNTSLEEIEIPSGVESIGAGCFEQCTFLAKLDFGPKSILRRLESNLFARCGIASFIVPAHVTTIDSDVFFHCRRLRELKFAPGSMVRMIGEQAFRGLPLRVVEIPDELRVLGRFCFAGCKLLSQVKMTKKSQLRRIDDGVFKACEALTSFELPPRLKMISKLAFPPTCRLVKMEV
jgi:hypothetical protein